MITKNAAIVIATLGSCLMLFLTEQARAQSGKKRAHSHGHTHRHSHRGHDHDHDHAHSPFTFGLGLVVSQSLGGKQSGEGGEGDSHAGHSHGLRRPALGLHEGHSDGGGDEGGGSASSGPTTEMSLHAGYRVMKPLTLNVGLGFSPDTGVNDPTLGATYAIPRKGMSFDTSFTASLPLSEESQKIYKITTLSLSTGPTWKRKKYTFGFKAKLSKTYYSKTIIVDDEEEAHDHALRGLSLQEDEDGHEHEVEFGETGTGDREFDRYGGTGNVGYRLNKRWAMNGAIGAAYVTHQFGAATFETTATLIQGTYSWKSLSTFLALMTSSEGESFALPTQPGFSAGVSYLYE